MKINSLAAAILGIGEFVLLYFLFRLGFGPMWIQYIACVVTIAFSLLVKPFVLIKQIDYTLKEILICYWTCLKTLSLSCILSAIPVYYLDNTISDSIIKSVLIVIIVAMSSYTFLDKQTKMKVNLLIRNKIHR